MSDGGDGPFPQYDAMQRYTILRANAGTAPLAYTECDLTTEDCNTFTDKVYTEHGGSTEDNSLSQNELNSYYSKAGPDSVYLATHYEYSLHNYDGGRSATGTFEATTSDFASTEDTTSTSKTADSASSRGATSKTTPATGDVTSDTIEASSRNTHLGHNSSFDSYKQTVGFADKTVTTAGTGDTVVVTLTLPTTVEGIPTTTWTTVASVSKNTVDVTVQPNSNDPITFDADRTTANTYVSSYEGEDGVMTRSAYVTDETVDGHHFSMWADEVILLREGRNAVNFALGDRLWAVSALTAGDEPVDFSALPNAATGRFTDVFKAYDSRRVTLSNLRMLARVRREVTFITKASFTYTSNLTSPTGGADTETTYTGVSSNGVAQTGAVTNTAGTTYTFDMGEVSHVTVTETLGYGEDTTTETKVVNRFTFQTTNYDTNGKWVSGTSEGYADHLSSRSESYTSLWSPASTTTTYASLVRLTRKAFRNITGVLSIGSRTSVYTIGSDTVDTTGYFWSKCVATVSTYEGRFNSTLEQWETNTEGVTATDGHSSGSTKKRWEAGGCTVNDISVLYPKVRWSHPIVGSFNAAGPNITVYRTVHPAGFGGFGGGFTAGEFTVGRGVSFTLVGGEEFAGQSFDPGLLPTVSVAEAHGLTFHPVVSGKTFAAGYGGVGRYLDATAHTRLGREAKVGVTWVMTALDGSSTVTRSKYATYLVNTFGRITGDFYSREELVSNTLYRFLNPDFCYAGGFGLGDNFFDGDYTVLMEHGFFDFTAFSGTQSDASATFGATATGNDVESRVINGKSGVVFRREPVFTVDWTGDSHLDYVLADFPFAVDTAQSTDP